MRDLRSVCCVLLVLVLAVTVMPINAQSVDTNQYRVQQAVSYLQNIAYNSDLQLCREAPRVASNVYWVASDNLLVYKALESYDSQLASSIKSRLIEIARTYSLPTSSDGVPLSLRYDVVVNDHETLDLPPKTFTHMTLFNDSYLLRHDLANGTERVENYREYADLLLLTALSNHNRGQDAEALDDLSRAIKMYDGNGLRDYAYESEQAYATYKLSLLLIVASRLGVKLEFQDALINKIWTAQDQATGGIYTHIQADGTTGKSDTNTETTAFTILGITSLQPQPLNWIMHAAIIISVALLVFALLIAKYMNKPKHS